MKIIRTLILVLIAPLIPLNAQSTSNKPSLLVGFYGGLNFSQPISLESYRILEPMTGDGAPVEKDYDGMFSNLGNQFGFALFYPLNGNFHIGLMPSLSTYSYKYENGNSWFDSLEPDALTVQTFKHDQKLRYIEIPFVIRQYLGTSSFKPYLQGVISYGFLHSANKSVDSRTFLSGETQDIPISRSQISADYSDAFVNGKFSAGAGAGFSYDFNQLIVTLDATWLFNFNSIVDEAGRYDNTLFTGASYDVQDKLILNPLFINLSIIFPANKITKSRSDWECNYFKQKRRR